MTDIGKMLVVLGALIIVAGLLVMFAGRMHLPLGRLPGDIVYRGKNTSFYFPVVTCIVVSVVLSAILWLIGKMGH